MNSTGKQLVIRADAGPEIGFGHVMRCLALAEFWQDTCGPVTFVCGSLPEPIRTRLTNGQFDLLNVDSAGDTVLDAQRFVGLLDRLHPHAVVADGYSFDTRWQSAVRQTGVLLMVIDDVAHGQRYDADILLNQNPFACDRWYEGRFDGQLLAGCRYALLRREFLNWNAARASIPTREPGQLLVTLGGYDPGGITQTVVEAIEPLASAGLSAIVVAPLAGLESNQAQITIVAFAGNMAELIGRCDLAICAGGSTNWEMCLMGVPRLVIELADNQRPIAAELHRSGCCLNLGWHQQVTARVIADNLQALLADKPRRASMRAANRQLVDGHGAERVCQILAARAPANSVL